MKHLCYYCGRELVKDVVLVTFYTKKCTNCQVSYHLDRNHVITMITLHTRIKKREYRVLHSLRRNKILIRVHSKEELGLDEVIDLDGDYNTINPSNLVEKLKTILTFL